MFQLIQPTTVKLMHINVRTEKHGPSDVDAVDLDMHIVGENRAVLGLLHPDLCGALYHCAAGEQGQETLEGLPDTLPNLRFGKLGDALPWSDEATGVDLTVIYGLGDEISNIKLEDGKASTKRIEPQEGGSCTVAFKFSVAGYPDGVIDKLRKKLKQEISITMVRPEKLRQDAIDGTKGHPALSGQSDLDIGESGPVEERDGQPDDEGAVANVGTQRRGRRAKTATEAFVEGG